MAAAVGAMKVDAAAAAAAAAGVAFSYLRGTAMRSQMVVAAAAVVVAATAWIQIPSHQVENPVETPQLTMPQLLPVQQCH